MAEENYKEYLAARVLAENRPVTYRLLSRAVKVNVNTAKHMLYEFHQKQNAKKPNAIHATYLVTGRKHPSTHTNGINGKDGDDIIMRSSPPLSSMPDREPEEPQEKPVSKTSIVLVREEELESTKAEFEEITSIHIYSLEPGPMVNLNVLSLCNQEIATEYTSEEPLERWKTYGCIHNPYIKRRTTKYNPVPQKPAAKPAEKPTAKPTSVTAPKKDTANASEDIASGKSTPQSTPTIATSKDTSKTTLTQTNSNSKPAPKDKSIGDIFKSFAKAKPKAAKAKEPEDEPMQGMSEDEGDPDEDDGPEIKIDADKAAAARKAREDNEKALRKMMEDDIEMLDVETPEPEKESQETVVTDATEEKEDAAKSESNTEPTVQVQGGRRRGRRRVTKKKKVQDADGYLVTKEETVWESFSEDEPEPKKLKPASKPAPSTAKGKKGAAKGQGSIASFFKKA